MKIRDIIMVLLNDGWTLNDRVAENDGGGSVSVGGGVRARARYNPAVPDVPPFVAYTTISRSSAHEKGALPPSRPVLRAPPRAGLSRRRRAENSGRAMFGADEAPLGSDRAARLRTLP